MRRLIYERFDLSLGTGLGKLKGRMFRIGHLGDSNDLTLLGTMAGCEMGLKLAGVKLAGSGVQAAMDWFAQPRGADAIAEGGLTGRRDDARIVVSAEAGAGFAGVTNKKRRRP